MDVRQLGIPYRRQLRGLNQNRLDVLVSFLRYRSSMLFTGGFRKGAGSNLDYCHMEKRRILNLDQSR